MDRRVILYVDDEPINLKIFSLAFQKKFKVEVADSGVAGLKKLDHLPEISIVISDMKMPGMNGIEFIKAARSNYPDRSYFILTGFDITSEISMAIQEGLIHSYFRKPFNLTEIETAIHQSLKTDS
ncbi:MAG TPA: response regulator [Bacteroidales bacterium]|nr:response regulator [Bacteroidales bacterium]